MCQKGLSKWGIKHFGAFSSKACHRNSRCMFLWHCNPVYNHGGIDKLFLLFVCSPLSPPHNASKQSKFVWHLFHDCFLVLKWFPFFLCLIQASNFSSSSLLYPPQTSLMPSPPICAMYSSGVMTHKMLSCSYLEEEWDPCGTISLAHLYIGSLSKPHSLDWAWGYSKLPM